MYYFPAGQRKRLVVAAIPTLNLPIKSISPSPSTSRRELVRAEIVVPVPIIYRNLAHFKQRILPLKLGGWTRTENDNNVVVFDLFNPTYTLPKLSLSVGTGLNFTVSVFNWLLPDDHSFYAKTKRSIQHISVTQVMASLEELIICQGLVINKQTNSLCEDPVPTSDSSRILKHSVPIRPDEYKES